MNLKLFYFYILSFLNFKRSPVRLLWNLPVAVSNEFVDQVTEFPGNDGIFLQLHPTNCVPENIRGSRIFSEFILFSKLFHN